MRGGSTAAAVLKWVSVGEYKAMARFFYVFGHIFSRACDFRRLQKHIINRMPLELHQFLTPLSTVVCCLIFTQKKKKCLCVSVFFNVIFNNNQSTIRGIAPPPPPPVGTMLRPLSCMRGGARRGYTRGLPFGNDYGM